MDVNLRVNVDSISIGLHVDRVSLSVDVVAARDACLLCSICSGEYTDGTYLGTLVDK